MLEEVEGDVELAEELEVPNRWLDSTHDVLRDIQSRIDTDCLMGRDLPCDMTDIGNEVGYIVGKVIQDMSEDDIENFLTGFRHGVSLTNGTH